MANTTGGGGSPPGLQEQSAPFEIDAVGAGASGAAFQAALLKRAGELREAGRLEEAEGVYGAILALDPSHARALLGQGIVTGRLGRLETSRQHLEASVRVAGTAQERFWAQMELVATLRQLKQFSAAAEVGRAAVSGMPGSQTASAWFRLGVAERSAGDAAAAKAAFERSLHLDAGFGQARLQLADILRASGQFAEARAQFELLKNDAAQGDSARLELYRLARREGRNGEAAAVLAEAHARNPQHAGLSFAMAAHLRDQGHLEEATRIYDRLLAADPSDAKALLGKGLIARRLRRRHEARALLEQAVAKAPDDPGPALELAIELRETATLAEALGPLDAFLAHSASATVRLHRAITLRSFNDSAAARCELEAMIAESPDAAGAVVELANLELVMGNPKSARARLEALRATGVRDAGLLFALARLEMSADRPDLARALYEELASAEPANWRARAGLARCCLLTGEHERGLELLAGLERDWGANPDCCMVLSAIERELGEWDKAHRRLRAAHARFPGHVPLWAMKSLYDIELCGDFERVEASALALSPSSREEQIHQGVTLAACALAQWKTAEAQRHLKQLQQLKPHEPRIYHRLILSDLLSLDLESAGRDLEMSARLFKADAITRGRSMNVSQSHYGQLFDEFRLDQEAAARVREALAAPPPDRIPGLLAAVRAFPGNTMAAIMVFIELRRQRRREDRRQADATSKAIPRLICQYWDDPAPPPDIVRLSASWQQQNPSYAVERYDYATALAYLRRHAAPGVVQAFRRAAEPAMKADIFRLAYLAASGGIYADADDLCRSSLEPLVASGAALTLYQEDIGTLGNNFIAAAPGHPVIERALDLAAAAVNRGDGDLLWLSTGPALLTRAAAAVLAEAGEARPGLLASMRILDRHELLRAVSIHCLTSYKHTKKHWSRTAFIAKEA